VTKEGREREREPNRDSGTEEKVQGQNISYKSERDLECVKKLS